MKAASANYAAPPRITIRVELFGRARIVSGRREVEIAVPEKAYSGDVAKALAEIAPELVGQVISGDGSGLLQSYTLNINGMSFVTDDQLNLKTGDSILLFSSQAGG